MYIPDIRLIVTDLDGTFLGEKSALIAENGRAFARAHEAGLHVAIASGRLADVCSRIAAELSLPFCRIIGMNGAQVLDAPFQKPVSEVFLPSALFDECLRAILGEKCLYNLYAPRRVYTNQPLMGERRERFLSNFARCGVEVVLSPAAAEEMRGQQCLKILFKTSGDDAAYARARSAVAAIPGVYLTTANAASAEVMQAGISKEQAVRALTRRLGISMENVLALGDFDNDAELLRAVGLSVAMENCSPAAFSAARLVTKKNTEAGVAHAVNALLSGALDGLSKGGRA